MFQRGHEEILKGLTRVFYPDLDRLGCICWHGVTRHELPKGDRASSLRAVSARGELHQPGGNPLR